MSLALGPTAPLGRPTGGHTNFPFPNPPAHLLFAHPCERRVRGELDTTTVVDTTGALLLHETRLLPRWCFPRDGARTDLRGASDTVTHCPFKGDATYGHLRVGDRLVPDAFWGYETPNPETPWLAGLLSPYVEKLDRWREEDEIVVQAGRGHPRTRSPGSTRGPRHGAWWSAPVACWWRTRSGPTVWRSPSTDARTPPRQTGPLVEPRSPTDAPTCAPTGGSDSSGRVGP